MARNIVRLANILLAGFVAIAVALLYWQLIEAPRLTRDGDLNRTRLVAEASRTRRGAILDRNGVLLAETNPSADGWQRSYRFPSLVHVVGYYSTRFGNSAVEARYDDYLRGAAGGNALLRLWDGLLHRQTDGLDVVLTVDSRLQQVADDAMGNDTGAIVALDPRTGEVLAMASHPYFDPNTMEADWDKLRDSQAKPFLNRATQGLYTPGSIFKTVTLASALEAGVTSPSEVFSYDMKINEQGQHYHDQLVQGFRIYDANHGPTEGHRALLDLAHAYAVSCNVAFADLGLRLGPRRLTEGANAFGFGAPIPIDLPAAISQLGSDQSLPKGDPAVASTAFGQGELAVTPLQMALVASAVANGGVIPIPHVVGAVRGQGSDVWRAVPAEWRRAMSAQTATSVSAMMVTSSEEGWAQTGRIPGIKVAGKTGTAETGTSSGNHAWFIAFAPADNPRVAVAVIKEHAGGGAANAGPAAKAVMEAALKYLPQP